MNQVNGESHLTAPSYQTNRYENEKQISPYDDLSFDMYQVIFYPVFVLRYQATLKCHNYNIMCSRTFYNIEFVSFVFSLIYYYLGS